MLEHGLHHVSVTDLGLHQVDVHLGHRLAEPEVGHDGRHHQILLQRTLGLHVSGNDGENHVAVRYPAILIDGDEPVGVPVERQSDPPLRFAGEHLGMGGAAAVD